MPAVRALQQNSLLAALPEAAQQRLAPNLKLVDMPLGKFLEDAGGEIRHAYFPTDAIISLLYVTADGASAATSMVGDQQLCRWLLLSLDRVPENTLEITQELIANILGVRREGVTEAAGKLRAMDVIEYHRGKITVLDRPKLESLSCECYAVVKKEFDRLLS